MVERTGNSTAELHKVQIIYYIYKCVLDASNHIYRLYDEISITLSQFIALVPITPDPDCVATLFRMVDFLAAFMEKINESSLECLVDYGDWFCHNDRILTWIFKIYSIRGV
jgi:hypothetical protein